jgi:mTERF
VDGSASVEELQQAAELELGERLAHVSAGLGKELATYPGMDLRGRVRGLKEVVGREDAAALLQSTPALLLHVRPSEVPARLDALATAFRTTRKAVVRLCSRTKGAGVVLQMLPHKTQHRVDALCSVLQLGPQKLLDVCHTSPKVLTVDPDRVLARAAALGERLGLDTAGVAELCRRDPSCLGVPPETVVAVVEAVRAALGVSREEAVQLCLRCPSVIHRSPANIAGTGRALKQQLGLQGGDLGECMVRHHPVGRWGALQRPVQRTEMYSHDCSNV